MKRILALALGLMLLCPALAETYVVDNYGTDEVMSDSMLLRDDGTPLTPARTFSNIYEITPSGTPEAEKLYAATPCDLGLEYDPETAEGMLYDTGYVRVGLMDAQGSLLTGCDYEYLDYENGYVIFTLPGENLMMGAMDGEGQVVIEPRYASLRHLGGGRWLAMRYPGDKSGVHRTYYDDGGYYDEYDFEAVYIDDAGVRSLGLHTWDRYTSVNADGICLISNVEEYGEQSVFVDSMGNVMFGRSFRYADNFVGDYAVVAEDERYGVIDRSGEYVVPQEYSYINWVEGWPMVATGSRGFTVYDAHSLDVLFGMDFGEEQDFNVTAITPELFGVTVDERTSIYDAAGNLLMAVPEDKDVQLYGYSADGTRRLVESYGEWPGNYYRLIDLSGEPVSGDFRLINGGVWQDGHGRFVTADYRIIRDAEGEEVVDWSSYRYGLIDEDGGTLLPNVYDELRALSYDRYWVTQGDRSGMIDASGNWYYAVSRYETLMD